MQFGEWSPYIVQLLINTNTAESVAVVACMIYLPLDSRRDQRRLRVISSQLHLSLHTVLASPSGGGGGMPSVVPKVVGTSPYIC